MKCDRPPISYRTERLSRNNLMDLRKLHLAVYGTAPSPEFFPNKYNTAFTGVMYTGFIAYNALKEPISFYGVIPCFLQIDGGKVLSAQSADTMVHPDYRKQGLFVELAKLTFALCKTEGINLLFGFPNQNSLHGFINKLNWRQSDNMDCFIIPIKTIPLEKISRKFLLFKSPYQTYLDYLLADYLTQAVIDDPALAKGFDGVLRDNNYMKYKSYSPTKTIRIDGVNIWLKINNGIMIGDISGLNNNFDKIIKKLCGLARWSGITQLQFHASPGADLHKFFFQRFTAQPSFPVIVKDLESGIQTERLKFTLADIDIF